MIQEIPRTLVEDYLTLVDDSCLAVLPHLLRTAVRLDVAKLLAYESATADELADRMQVDADHLHRLLRALTSIGMLERVEGQGFALTPLGRRLHADATGSVRESLINTDTAHAMLSMHEVIRTGASNFGDVHGDGFFSHKDQETAANRAFVRRMQERSGRCYPRLVEAIDWSSATTVMDIGGANGVVLENILNHTARLRGILFDRPGMATEVDSSGVLERLNGRIRFETGDFFDSVPTGADTHIMASVLHDWSDADAVRILQSSRKALDAGGVLYVAEMLLPEDYSWHPSTWSDIGMMVLTGGRERTSAEYRGLLAQAGFELTGTRTIQDSHFSVLKAQ